MKRIFLIFFATVLCNFIYSQNRLNEDMLWKLGRISEIKTSPDGKNILYGVTYYDVDANKGNRDLFTIGIAGGAPKKITDFSGSEFNGIWRPDGGKIGFLSAEGGSVQIWETNPGGTDKKQISNIVGGVNGFAYAPNSKHILFIKDVKLDKTVNDVYPDLPKANARIIDELMYRHWDSWHDYSYSHIFVASYDNGEIGTPKDIMENERFDSPLMPHGGMEEIVWSPDGKFIAYTCKKLNGKAFAESTNSDIYLFNLEDGSTVNISEGMEGYDKCPVFSPDGKYIAWQSMKTPGYESDKERLMLYDRNSKKIIDLTEKFEHSATNLLWSKDSKKIFFISGIRATYQIYVCTIASKDIKKVTDGTHDYQDIQLAGNTLIGAKMSMSMPTEVFSINAASGIEKQLTFTNKDILSKVKLGKVEPNYVSTNDGKQMLVWVIYPPEFDKTKKYPALLYCQGGPQSAVSQFFSYRWNFQVMASHDYIIVAPNRRGLPSFGQEWNDQIAGDYGGQNMQDYLSAIDYIAKEPYVNKDKLGAVGASYGGYSVYWLAGNHNNRFKAFIAHCGMFNFESWYGETEELFFANHDLGGPYWAKNRPKSYDFSAHHFIGHWNTPLMVVHGGNDFRIPYTQGMQAFNAAQIQGIPSRFLFFPEETHFVLKPQNALVWQREFFRWFDQYLK